MSRNGLALAAGQIRFGESLAFLSLTYRSGSRGIFSGKILGLYRSFDRADGEALFFVALDSVIILNAVFRF